MSISAAAKNFPLQVVVPDCCNVGVIFRTLVLVNGTVLATALLRTSSLQAGLLDFMEACAVVNWACLFSLLALCCVRRLLFSPQIQAAFPVWTQRALCALVPAVVTSMLLYFLFFLPWFTLSFTHLTSLEGALVAAMFGLILQHYFELRMRAFSPALSEARLQALQARIRPHFLFNSLNAVLSLIRTEPQRAEAALEDLADLFRVLMRDTRATTSLHAEIILCKQYLSIEKIRLGERLQVEWDTGQVSEDVLQKTQISSLLLQPLLENAVRYGVEPSSIPALIEIRISRTLDRIEIMVANPHHGAKQAAPGNQMALDNIRERLTLLYDVEAQLAATCTGGRFEVRLRFPFVRI